VYALGLDGERGVSGYPSPATSPLLMQENFAYDPGASTEDSGSYNSIDSSSDYHSAWMHSQGKDHKGSAEEKERRDRDARKKAEDTVQGIGMAPSVYVHQDA